MSVRRCENCDVRASTCDNCERELHNGDKIFCKEDHEVEDDTFARKIYLHFCSKECLIQYYTPSFWDESAIYLDEVEEVRA